MEDGAIDGAGEERAVKIERAGGEGGGALEGGSGGGGGGPSEVGGES